MCGIGKSAIYLCPDKICRSKFYGMSNFYPTENCQCAGKGYIGSNACAKSNNCFERTPTFSQCTSLNVCPKGWSCNRKQNYFQLITNYK